MRQPLPLVLASSSPRRREILGQLGLEFEIEPPDVDESRHGREAPEAYARRLSVCKARAVADSRPEAAVLRILIRVQRSRSL